VLYVAKGWTHLGMLYYGRRSSSRSRFLTHMIAGFVGAIVGGLLVASILTGVLVDKNGVPFWRSQSEGEQVASGDRSELENIIIGVADTASPSVVMITTTEQRVIPFVFETLVQEVRGLGSGVIFSEEGHILTNRHVVADATEIAVVLPDGREFSGEDVQIVGLDYLTDLAVLRIRGEGFPVAKLGDSDAIVPGELAVAIGNPYGLDHTITYGIVSALDRPVTLDSQRGLVLNGLIQTSAPINVGNSGGPLLNRQGGVIGINTAIIQEAQSIGFAIPINTAKQIVDTLIKYGRVSHPWIGIDAVEITDEVIKELDIPITGGIGVANVVQGSPADRAGLIPGDVITQINGKSIASLKQLIELKDKLKVGERLLLTVVRVREEIMVPLTVGEFPVR
jgi:serine protease Do